MTNRIAGIFRRLGRPLPKVGQTPADVVHAENKWRLLRYRPRPEGPAFETPLLLVPSLINRHYVLDLQPGKSFAEWLVARGHDVYVIDWGTPADEDRYLGFDDITDGYIGRAIRVAARAGGRGKTHVLGYCLGGTLAAIHIAARPESPVAGFIALAAPVAFGDDGLLATWTRVPGFDVGALVDATGNVPWPLMQAAFHMLRPTLTLSKAIHVIDRIWDDPAVDGVLALETWGHDNVSFPGECYRRYIEELYRKDALIRGDFTLSGRPAQLEAIRCPTLAVTFENDHIVPGASAAPLIERIGSPDKERVHLAGGHVGAVVSRSASQSLWPRLSAWMAARDADVTGDSAESPAPPQVPGPAQRASSARASRRSRSVGT